MNMATNFGDGMPPTVWKDCQVKVVLKTDRNGKRADYDVPDVYVPVWGGHHTHCPLDKWPRWRATGPKGRL
ncbi:MAG: hypothetical protein R2738_04070 [Bacteroides graminisolvens]